MTECWSVRVCVFVYWSLSAFERSCVRLNNEWHFMTLCVYLIGTYAQTHAQVEKEKKGTHAYYTHTRTTRERKKGKECTWMFWTFLQSPMCGVDTPERRGSWTRFQIVQKRWEKKKMSCKERNSGNICLYIYKNKFAFVIFNLLTLAGIWTLTVSGRKRTM